MAGQGAKRDPNAVPALIAHSNTSESAETRRVVATDEGDLAVSSIFRDDKTIDSFGRMRTSNPITLFDSKQLFDNQPLFWDDAETSGGGTSTSHSAATATTTIAVSANTAGTRVRQSFQRFNYQPGKSQLITMTWANMSTGSGITKRAGYFDENNGMFFQHSNGSASVVRRSKATGSVVNTAITQSAWNIDPLDGTGSSGITLDFTKVQFGVIDFQWQGVGRVRMGFDIDGKIYYCHQFLHSNLTSTVFMSTSNLPCRYEISNSGTGGADSFGHICVSVSSESGQDKNGIVRHKHSGSISGLVTPGHYALLGLRLKSGSIGGVVELENMSIIDTVKDKQALWMLVWNPTVAGTFTYGDETNSTVQTAVGAASNTITGGTYLDGGYFTTTNPVSALLPNALKLGSKIDGTLDTVVLSITPIITDMTVQASWSWRELS